jgi:hypothetical protein
MWLSLLMLHGAVAADVIGISPVSGPATGCDYGENELDEAIDALLLAGGGRILIDETANLPGLGNRVRLRASRTLDEDVTIGPALAGSDCRSVGGLPVGVQWDLAATALVVEADATLELRSVEFHRAGATPAATSQGVDGNFIRVDDGTLRVRNGSFTGGLARRGGAIAAFEGVVDLRDTDFFDNRALLGVNAPLNASGGALYFGPSAAGTAPSATSRLEVRGRGDCQLPGTFFRNEAAGTPDPGGGGAVAVHGVRTLLSGVCFSDNHGLGTPASGASGGALYAASDPDTGHALVVAASIFERNTSGVGGGAVHLTGGILGCDNCVGGAAGGGVTITASRFDANRTVPLGARKRGGAIWSDATGDGVAGLTPGGDPVSLGIEDTVFDTNTAQDGGALAMESAGSPVAAYVSADFVGNGASFDGGGVYVEDDVALVVVDASFSGDSGRGAALAAVGGVEAPGSRPDVSLIGDTAPLLVSGTSGTAIVAERADLHLERCHLDTNVAPVGAAGALDALDGAVVVLDNVLVSDNAGLAASVRVVGSDLTATHTTIVDEQVGVGLDMDFHNGGSVVLQNSLVWDNAGGSFKLNGPPSASAECSNIEGFLIPGAFNRNDDPQFVDASTGDFRLLPTSPSKDVCPMAPLPDDLDGGMRTGLTSIGAYE